MPELPPPLPPEERTVGQLIAETIRTYGDNFWRALPLGLPLALATPLAHGRSPNLQSLTVLALAPLIAFAYAVGCAVALGARVTVTSYVLALLVFLPVPFLLRLYVLPALAWLALFGLSVPAAMVEGLPYRAALARARRLATADYVHALGSLAALVIVFFVSRLALIMLLQGQADNTIRVAAFLADLVLAPVMLLGAAMLYVDQAARVGTGRRKRREADAI